MSPGKSIVASKTIDGKEELFRDHFPGFPVVPGVLLTEMMAQTAGKCLDAERKPRGKTMLARIVSASFRNWVMPDQTAVIYANIKSNHNNYASANCWIEVNSKKICTSELFFTFVEMNKFNRDYVDEVLESFFSGKAVQK